MAHRAAARGALLRHVRALRRLPVEPAGHALAGVPPTRVPRRGARPPLVHRHRRLVREALVRKTTRGVRRKNACVGERQPSTPEKANPLDCHLHSRSPFTTRAVTGATAGSDGDGYWADQITRLSRVQPCRLGDAVLRARRSAISMPRKIRLELASGGLTRELDRNAGLRQRRPLTTMARSPFVRSRRSGTRLGGCKPLGSTL
jgi:hypothetical protein